MDNNTLKNKIVNYFPSLEGEDFVPVTGHHVDVGKCESFPKELLPWEGSIGILRYDDVFDEYRLSVVNLFFSDVWFKAILKLGQDGKLMAPFPAKAKIQVSVLKPKLNGHRFRVEHCGNVLKLVHC